MYMQILRTKLHISRIQATLLTNAHMVLKSFNPILSNMDEVPYRSKRTLYYVQLR